MEPPVTSPLLAAVPRSKLRTFLAWVAAVAGLALLWATYTGRLARKETMLQIETKVEYAGGRGCGLAFTVTNKGSEPVEFLESILPWQDRTSLTLVLVESDGARTIVPEPISPIDDLNAVVVKLAPRETIKGVLLLAAIYPTLATVIESSRVDVFYAYEFRAIGGRQARRVGGWLNIPIVKATEIKEEAQKDGYNSDLP